MSEENSNEFIVPSESASVPSFRENHAHLASLRNVAGKYSMVAITNDIYTLEDAKFLARQEALPEDRIMGVETGGCPHGNP